MVTSPGWPLRFPQPLRDLVDPYLPIHSNVTPPITPDSNSSSYARPHLTLTYAQSLDASIALKPGSPTALSGPSSKAMTHYLRSRHDVIMVGCGTAIADDPTLNSRLEGMCLDVQPHPVILDRNGRWLRGLLAKSNICRAAKEGAGRGPLAFVAGSAWEDLVAGGVDDQCKNKIESCGGQIIVESIEDFGRLLDVLGHHGVRSIMVEGGGTLINALLGHFTFLIDVIITTVAPVYLGSGGVKINPLNSSAVEGGSKQPSARLSDIRWIHLDSDAVVCARIQR